ncbi:uncharacterized protein A4U43_C04F11300 [Asparagus officinalis]|uniref:Uncharacterized protein n=1 Tax=Asparagus officinalis TaxID=4686 RepID=A0A5P1F007_ASPOF|nr:uncharacterized protein A4U43_C04F11300 [Asparagus officinalis]
MKWLPFDDGRTSADDIAYVSEGSTILIVLNSNRGDDQIVATDVDADLLFLSLLERILNVLPSLHISSNPPSLCSLLDRMRIDGNPSRVQESDAGGGGVDALKRIASPDGIYFPCGLPSLRFFIDDEGKIEDPSLLLLIIH